MEDDLHHQEEDHPDRAMDRHHKQVIDHQETIVGQELVAQNSTETMTIQMKKYRPGGEKQTK